jgi:hypothetical protein
MPENNAAAAPASNSPFNQPLREGATAPGGDAHAPSADKMDWHTASPAERKRRTTAAGAAYADQMSGHPSSEPWVDPNRQSKDGAPQGGNAKPDKPAGTVRNLANPGDLDPAAKSEPMVRVSDTLEVPEAKFKEVLAELSAREVGQHSTPPTADGYKIELPKDFKAPVGAEGYALNEKDPRLPALREVALKHKLSNSALNDLVAVGAAHEAHQMAVLQHARQAELGKLGPTASGRVTAVQTFFNGYLDKADAEALNNTLWTSGIITAFEKLITKVASGHGSTYSNANRDGGGRQGVSDAVWDSWSYGQRSNYARTGDPNRAA